MTGWPPPEKESGARKGEKRFMESMVNHPAHYNGGKYEVIDVIEDWGLNFSRGSAIKYIARAGKKPGETEVQDLEKAAWYIQREIERIRKAEETE